ncbi:MAG: hypothetical protein JZU47_13645 [Prolixibacteraceae bacterium]|nr:hypothetical protein [Prolixibacteraceae bacterium]
MKPIFSILFFVLFIISSVSGQIRVIPQPTNRVIYIDGHWRRTDSRTTRKWYVVSDRKDNQVFSDRTLNSVIPNFKLKFDETVYVFDYDSLHNSLRVARGLFVNAGGQFIGTANEIGWVKEESMVLSRYCIRTKNNPLLDESIDGLYTRKVFIFNTPGNYQNPTFYSDPNMNVGDNTGTYDVYTIFYVYKEFDNKLLLGRYPEKESFVGNNLIGWIPKNRTSSWNHNMCFEKNWNIEAVKERGMLFDSKLPARIFGIREDAEAYLNGRQQFQIPALYDEDIDSISRYQPQRIKGTIFRSPIISTVNESIYKVGYLSRGGDFRTDSARNVFLTCFRDLLDQLNTINLVFLIDGTHSIIPYKNTIIDNLRDAFNSLTQNIEGSRIRLRYHAIIYRDDPYPLPFERSGPTMTTNSTEIVSFINNRLVPQIRLADDQPEALFMGFKYINERLNDIREFEKTFVIVIGDASSHQRRTSPSFVSEQEVLDILLRKNYSISAIQVKDRTVEPAYDQFRSQFKNLLIRYYRERSNIVIPPNSIQNMGRNKRFPNEDLRIPSMLIFPSPNDSLTGEALGAQLRKLIIEAPMADFKVDMPCRIPRSALSYLRIDPQDPDFDKKAIYGINNWYYIDGFLSQYTVNRNNQRNKFKLFNDVQYFKENELNTIKEQLERLIPDNSVKVNNSLSARERLYNIWYNILVKRLQVVDALDFGKITLREASLFLTQNKGRKEWADIKMENLTTRSIFTDEMLGVYYFDWFTTKLMIQSILADESKFTQSYLKDHSDVFKYCYDLLTGNDLKKLSPPEQQAELNRLISRALTHYSSLKYDQRSYIHDIARCKGQISNISKDYSQSNLFEAWWISGEYFPYDNEFCKNIFQKL